MENNFDYEWHEISMSNSKESFLQNFSLKKHAYYRDGEIKVMPMKYAEGLVWDWCITLFKKNGRSKTISSFMEKGKGRAEEAIDALIEAREHLDLILNIPYA